MDGIGPPGVMSANKHSPTYLKSGFLSLLFCCHAEISQQGVKLWFLKQWNFWGNGPQPLVKIFKKVQYTVDILSSFMEYSRTIFISILIVMVARDLVCNMTEMRVPMYICSLHVQALDTRCKYANFIAQVVCTLPVNMTAWRTYVLHKVISSGSKVHFV